MALAPRRVQNVPDFLSRDPMMVLHPASITPESMKRCCFRKMSGACDGRCAKSISASMRIRWQRWLAGFSIERVTGASQFHIGLARSRGRGREAQQFADDIEIRANSRLARAFVGMALPIPEQGFHDLPAIGNSRAMLLSIIEFESVSWQLPSRGLRIGSTVPGMILDKFYD
jgi:hypothetical protein